MSSKTAEQLSPQEQLQSLLNAFPREEARRMKARAFWLARRRRKREKAKKDQRADGEALCPITLVPISQLKSPCVASDGGIYERDALETWSRRNPTSPLSREPLSFGVPLRVARRAVVNM